MPPKKQKKKDKLANMTEEERAAYLEQQKLAEEEAKAKKAALLNKYLQDKLEREEKACKSNLMKVNHHWRAIMRDAKSVELRKDIDVLSQTFERVIDRKNNIMKTLIKDLNESEEQYMMSFRTHIQNIDNMLELQNIRLQKAKTDYEQELNKLTEAFEQEEKFLIEQHTKQLDDLKDIFVALDSTYTQKATEAKTEQHSLKDELKNKNLEDKHALRMALEARVNQLWGEYKLALTNYNRTTEEKILMFENLKQKDEKSAAEIEMQMSKLQRISEQIANSKRRMGKLAKDFDEKNHHLKEEREKLVAHFQTLKKQLNQLREKQHQKLVKLSLESGQATKHLQKLLDKAEKIIKLAEHCRKYETEEEKVVPFYVSSLTEEEENMVKEAYQVDGDEELAKIMRQCAPMEMFWRRFNKVQLDRLAVMKEHCMLEQENTQLKLLLKQYLDGISVNEEVIENANSLIVINGRSNVRRNLLTDPRVRLLNGSKQLEKSKTTSMNTVEPEAALIWK